MESFCHPLEICYATFAVVRGGIASDCHRYRDLKSCLLVAHPMQPGTEMLVTAQRSCSSSGSRSNSAPCVRAGWDRWLVVVASWVVLCLYPAPEAVVSVPGFWSCPCAARHCRDCHGRLLPHHQQGLVFLSAFPMAWASRERHFEVACRHPVAHLPQPHACAVSCACPWCLRGVFVGYWGSSSRGGSPRTGGHAVCGGQSRPH
jgi:hypothetical protein